jgi:hypothetical protein
MLIVGEICFQEVDHVGFMLRRFCRIGTGQDPSVLSLQASEQGEQQVAETTRTNVATTPR